MAGDPTVPGFDNARNAVKALIEEDGVLDGDTIQLSRRRNQLSAGVRLATIASFEAAMLELDTGGEDACFLFMTSHGTEDGFLIRGDSYMTPGKLDQILDDACGELPTVALISACYSGMFIEPAGAPNRIILTASRADRASFGCAAESTYPYWDECLLTNWRSSDTWEDLHSNIQPCVEAMEEAQGFTPSLPQALFGDDVRGLRILNR